MVDNGNIDQNLIHNKQCKDILIRLKNSVESLHVAEKILIDKINNSKDVLAELKYSLDDINTLFGKIVL